VTTCSDCRIADRLSALVEARKIDNGDRDDGEDEAAGALVPVV
jgi:hypothetical protein